MAKSGFMNWREYPKAKFNIKGQKMDKQKLENWLYILNYWLDEIQELAERFPDMDFHAKKYEQMIDEIYNLIKKGA